MDKWLQDIFCLGFLFSENLLRYALVMWSKTANVSRPRKPYNLTVPQGGHPTECRPSCLCGLDKLIRVTICEYTCELELRSVNVYRMLGFTFAAEYLGHLQCEGKQKPITTNLVRRITGKFAHIPRPFWLIVCADLEKVSTVTTRWRPIHASSPWPPSFLWSSFTVGNRGKKSTAFKISGANCSKIMKSETSVS